MSRESLVVQAPAKINLFLKILGRRADGYHNLISLVQAVSLCDTLTLRLIESGTVIRCNQPDIPCDERNLVHRAITLLRQQTGFADGVEIDLVKRIPHGAGLGGGSSDAAATLKAVNRLAGLGLARSELAKLSAEIGSDVPFFFSGGSAIIRGRGEVVENVDITADYHVLLVVPDFSVATAEAYRKLNFPLTKRTTEPSFNLDILSADFCPWLGGIGNDFQSLLLKEFPAVDRCLNLLKDAGAGYAALTGSGSAFFGLFGERPAPELATIIPAEFGWEVYSLVPVTLE